MTYRITARNLEKLTETVARLNRRAARLGCEPIVISEIGTEDVPSKYDGILTHCHIIELSGSAPKLNGWALIARVQFLNDTPVFFAVPGQTIPAELRTLTQHCDHCNVDRFRNDTFLVKNESGEIKQVGRQCLADFLGYGDPRAWVESAEMLIEVMTALDLLAADSENELGGEYHAPSHHDYIETLTYLGFVAAQIRQFGWLSRSAAKESLHTATADEAWDLMTRRPTSDKDRAELNKLMPVEADLKMAADALAWAQSLSGDSEYTHNLLVIAQSKTITYQMMGYAASIVSGYQREKGVQAERAHVHESEYLGEVGKKIELTLTLNGIQSLPSVYGVTSLMKFTDDAGNSVTWFASGDKAGEEGERFAVKATVKKHEEFRGVKQTIITRAKLEKLPA